MDNAHLTPERLQSFFDAIVAFSMTLLVVGLAIPESGPKPSTLFELVVLMFPQFYHFAISFFILGSFWKIHHQIFAHVHHVNTMMVRLTMVTLFVICFIPFTSTLSGDASGVANAIILFHFNLLFLGTLFMCQWHYLITREMIHGGPADHYRHLMYRSAIVPVTAIIAIIVAVWEPDISSILYLFMSLFIAIINWRSKNAA